VNRAFYFLLTLVVAINLGAWLPLPGAFLSLALAITANILVVAMWATQHSDRALADKSHNGA
jgi:hypothetical protein